MNLILEKLHKTYALALSRPRLVGGLRNEQRQKLRMHHKIVGVT